MRITRSARVESDEVDIFSLMSTGTTLNFKPTPGGGRLAGGTRIQKGAAPALHILRKKGSFLRPRQVRDFVIEGYFFCTQVQSIGCGGGGGGGGGGERVGGGGVKVPFQSTKYTRL